MKRLLLFRLGLGVRDSKKTFSLGLGSESETWIQKRTWSQRLGFRIGLGLRDSKKTFILGLRLGLGVRGSDSDLESETRIQNRTRTKRLKKEIQTRTRSQRLRKDWSQRLGFRLGLESETRKFFSFFTFRLDQTLPPSRTEVLKSRKCGFGLF